MNILVNLPPGFFSLPELATIWERLERLGAIHRNSHNTADEIRPDLANADAVLMWSWPALTEGLLDAAPHLKFAAHIDVTQRAARTALARNLPVSVSRSGFCPAVAEMALALILATLRRTSAYHAEMRRGEEAWITSFPEDISPQERELSGANVGIIGLGGVGRRLAELLAPFHCHLRVVDPYVPESVLQTYGATRVELDEMLSESDVVVLCAASNAGTQHLLGAAQIARLRPQAIFVNVARAALVDTPALVARLKQEDLFAALDVFDREPLDREDVLRTLPNVYLTPHRAGGTLAAIQRIIGWLVDDMEAHFAGVPRRYALTEAMLPGLDVK